MHRIKYAVLLLLLIIGNNWAVAQNASRVIDSLLSVLAIAKQDTALVNTINALSRQYRIAGDLKKDRLYADSAIALARGAHYRKGEAYGYTNLGHNAGAGGDYSAALKNHQAALKISQEIGDKTGISLSYLNMGMVLLNTGDYDEALSNFQASLKLREELGDKKLIADTRRNIGNIYHARGDYQEALEIYLSVLKIYRELGDNSTMAVTYGNLGYLYADQGKYSEALKSNAESIKLDEEIGRKESLAISYNNNGTIYQSLGNYPEAMKNFLFALKLYEQTGSKGKMASTYLNIGNIYYQQENLQEALGYYQQSLKIFRETKSKWGIALVLNNIGSVYVMQKNYSGALEKYTETLAMHREMKDKNGEAGAYFGIGRVHEKQGNYPEALRNYFISLNLYEETGAKPKIAFVYTGIGKLYSREPGSGSEQSRQQHYVKSINYLNKGLTLAREVGEKELVKNSYKALADVYREMKQYEKALEFNRLYIEIKDSLVNNETTRKLEQQRTQYEVEKAVAEEKAEKEKALAEERIASGKKLAEERLLQEKIVADERVAHEKRMADERTRHELQAAQEKFLFDLALADERTVQEKIKAEEQLKNEKTLAEEKYKSVQALAAIKAEQEKEKAAIKARNEKLLLGAGMLIFALVFVFLYLRQRTLKQRAMERTESVHKMAELELQSLRAQLNPHFMFNSLNAIQELILLEDNERSHVYLSRFSKLIRMLLDNASLPFIPLKKEIEFLELYLSLEKLRIPDLQFTVEIEPEIDSNITSVPNMMLQPYIENAIWHGLSPKNSDKKLALRIYRQNGAVQYEIEDNGIGRKKAAALKGLYRKEHKSKGMELLTKRFKLLREEFGSEIKTTIDDLAETENTGGTRVIISVPFALSWSKKEAIT